MQQCMHSTLSSYAPTSLYHSLTPFHHPHPIPSPLFITISSLSVTITLLISIIFIFLISPSLSPPSGCVHTFGKAVGQHGAAVLTNHAVLLQYLINYCSPIIYSTSLPLFNILAIRESYDCIRRCHLERDHLKRLIDLFKEGARKYELPCLISSTCIQGVIIPTNEAVVRVSRELYQSNMHCFPIRAPTVATGSERLRIILHAHNTEDEVRYLCRRLADVHAP